MEGYTIKSESCEGVYYLVKNWEKHRTFWKEREKLKPDMIYKTPQAAKASLTKLLKIMEDYRSDKFTLENAAWTPERIKAAFNFGHGTPEDLRRYMSDNAGYAYFVTI